jgi:hypothetical protein
MNLLRLCLLLGTCALALPVAAAEPTEVEILDNYANIARGLRGCAHHGQGAGCG